MPVARGCISEEFILVAPTKTRELSVAQNEIPTTSEPRTVLEGTAATGKTYDAKRVESGMAEIEGALGRGDIAATQVYIKSSTWRQSAVRPSLPRKPIEMAK